MAKTSQDRFDQTVSNVKTLVGDKEFKVLKTVARGLGNDGQQDVGGHMSLGAYIGSSTELTEKRHLKRAILLAEFTLGGKAYTAKSSILERIKNMSKSQLVNDAKLLISPKAIPTAIVSKSFSVDPQKPSDILHVVGWGSSTRNLKQLCYVATREWVIYTHIIKGVRQIDLDMYGGEMGWPTRDASPWFPSPRGLAPDNPSTTRVYPNGMMGTASDNHFLSIKGTMPSLNLHFGAPLVESELHADQVYQYNDTADEAKWTDNKTWKAFESGRWSLVRKIYQDSSTGKWMYEFTKKGAEVSNRNISQTTRSPILDYEKPNKKARYGYDEV